MVEIAVLDNADAVREFLAAVAEDEWSAAVEDFDEVKQEPTFLACPHERAAS